MEIPSDNKVKEAIEPTATPKVEEAPKKDLLTRVSEFKPEPTVPITEKGTLPLEEASKNFKTVEEAVEWARSKEKDWASGYGKKFQDLADERKQFETQKGEFSNWSPEKVQALLKDESFVESAKVAAKDSSQYSDDGSVLSAEEQQAAKVRDHKIRTLESELYLTRKNKEDEALKTKYPDYNSAAMDIVSSELISGKRQATRENLHWAVNGPEIAEKAYQLGRKDERENKKSEYLDKSNSSAIDSGVVVDSTDRPQPKEGESASQFIVRSYLHNLPKVKK